MNGSVSECQNKYHRVLSLITPQEVISDDTFLEKIQTYLSSETDYNEFVKDPETLLWLDQMANAFDSNETDLPTQQLANFTLKILSLICSNEWQFASIKEKNLLEKIQTGIEKHAKLQKPSIKLGHIQLLQSISSHSIGLHWLKQTSSWRMCIKYFENNSTMFIMREAGNFLYNILTKFSDQMKDEKLCIEILETILDPLINNDWKKSADRQLLVDDEAISRMLTPGISIATHMLTLCVESKKRSRIAYYILLKYRFENNLWLVADGFECDVDFLTLTVRGHVAANFARLSSMDIPSSDTIAVDLTFDLHTIHFYNLMLFAITRRLFKCVNFIAEMHHQLWYKLGDRAPKEVVLENHDLKFGDQVIMLQTLPIIYVIKSRYKANAEYINELCEKMFNMSCEHTIRLLYQYRDGLTNENFDFIADLAAKSIQGILSLKKFLNRDRATLALQIFVYVLKGYVDDPCNEMHEEKISNTQLLLQAPNLLSALLIALNEMIKSFKFTWKECIESTAIVSLLLVLLKDQNLSSRQTVESLKLIQVSIEHFLAPNLALLLDKMDGSGMEDLGPTIYKRLHDYSWEVRDSTLELLYSIVEISQDKFPAFQKHILENKLCQTVEMVARNDSEPYVRASAFKVLSAMIKIKLFWHNVLCDLDLKKYVVEVLGTESEGVVRREAVACITNVYSHQTVPPPCLDSVLSVLAHCAVNDFYWEVKTNALDFWKMVICRQFSYQGMIDGTFPTVTFSKEHRKIITLNDKEIQLRLKKVLNELAMRGCLGILIECLQDSDLEVVKKAVRMVEKIMGYLNKYNYVEEYNRSKKEASENISENSSEKFKPVIDINYSEFKKLSGEKEPSIRNNADFSKTTNVSVSAENGELVCPDDVIESIIRCDDLKLLSDTYNKSNCNMKDAFGHIDENLFRKFATVSPDDFLNFVTTTDLNKLIQDKSEWLQHTENFSSLLDDVLLSFGREMDLDCY